MPKLKYKNNNEWTEINIVGEKGQNGLSAYEVAVDNGFIGTEQQWLDTLKGDTGATGPQGEKGDTGATGPRGPAGNDYVLTDADKQAIAQIAMNGLNGNGVVY